MDCEHCFKKFSNQSNLTRHQKTSVSCLKIQRSKNLDIIERFVQCDKCLKKCRFQNELKNHKCVPLNTNNSDTKTTNDTKLVINKLVDMIREQNKLMDVFHKQIDVLREQVDVLHGQGKKITKPELLKEYSNTPVIYLIEDPYDVLHRLTYGRTKNLKKRIYQYYLSFKCVAPIVHFYKQMTNKETKDIESILHKIFRDYKNPENSEWIGGISSGEAIGKINSTIELYNIGDKISTVEKERAEILNKLGYDNIEDLYDKFEAEYNGEKSKVYENN